ncbi:hypothetical protein [Aliivibrio wodanis]|uniref:hypothetical protein n=1 Tax=Aliivibrio wodanis TaxID=80852 RepID=UPI00406C948C
MTWLRKLLGFIPSEEDSKKYEIEPEMVNPDVVRMNMESFRNSKVVKAQAKAAKALS